jgi:hypothetical protein
LVFWVWRVYVIDFAKVGEPQRHRCTEKRRINGPRQTPIGTDREKKQMTEALVIYLLFIGANRCSSVAKFSLPSSVSL